MLVHTNHLHLMSFWYFIAYGQNYSLNNICTAILWGKRPKFWPEPSSRTLHIYFLCASSRGSGKTASICNEQQKFVSWLGEVIQNSHGLYITNSVVLYSRLQLILNYVVTFSPRTLSVEQLMLVLKSLLCFRLQGKVPFQKFD